MEKENFNELRKLVDLDKEVSVAISVLDNFGFPAGGTEKMSLCIHNGHPYYQKTEALARIYRLIGNEKFKSLVEKFKDSIKEELALIQKENREFISDYKVVKKEK